jgi:hypothetical protein
VHFLREDTGHEQPSVTQETSVEFKKAIEAKSTFTKVPLDPKVPDITVCIGAETNPEEQAKLLLFLDKNNDVFSWSTSDLIGVNREVIEHRLQVNLNTKPKKQKLHNMSNEKAEATRAEVQCQLDAGFIREVTNPQWLANVVMVRKKNGKWRMCMDFTDLNKCFRKDDFPLARIDQIGDSAAGYEIMALLDYFLGYHQIWLRKEDEEKTSFRTSFGTYCYTRMPEGLCNVGPMFHRMKKAALKDQICRNVFSYIVNILAASNKKSSYIFDLTKTFANMREAKLKLNPDKCVFYVGRGKVLGCLDSTKGIEGSPL